MFTQADTEELVALYSLQLRTKLAQFNARSRSFGDEILELQYSETEVEFKLTKTSSASNASVCRVPCSALYARLSLLHIGRLPAMQPSRRRLG